MLQKLGHLIPLLTLAAIIIIPIICFFLYKRKKFRRCIIASHLWCMITFFLLGIVFFHFVRRYNERTHYADNARQLLGIIKNLRQEGDTKHTISSLDAFFANILYRTIYDVPDSKIKKLNPEILSLWQEVKEYYEINEIKEPYSMSAIPEVRRKLAQVPWSYMQLAIKKFEQTYGNGMKALAPSINPKSWLTQLIPNEELQNKVILLDFWNTHCGPCIKSLPDLQKLYDKYKDKNFVVITCASGSKKETKDFLNKNGYTFPACMISNQMFYDYAIRANPTYFLIDRDGHLVWGPDHRLPTDDEILNLVN